MSDNIKAKAPSHTRRDFFGIAIQGVTVSFVSSTVLAGCSIANENQAPNDDPTPPTSAAKTVAAKQEVQVDLRNQMAIRNRPITELLTHRIRDSVGAVYGTDYRVVVYSGGQAPLGSGGSRTGSVRHDDHGKGGRAADIYIFDPDGNRVTNFELIKLGEYFLAAGYGSVGFGMANGGLHLDEWVVPPKGGTNYWLYSRVKGTPLGNAAFSRFRKSYQMANE